jgi:hypothetical protein
MSSISTWISTPSIPCTNASSNSWEMVIDGKVARNVSRAKSSQSRRPRSIVTGAFNRCGLPAELLEVLEDLPVGLGDGHVVDAGDPPAHQALVVEFPQLVSV